MAKFKVGDKVRVKQFSTRPMHWSCVGLMDFLMGKVVTVEEYVTEHGFMIDGGWALMESDVEIEPRREFIVIRRDGAKTIAELRHDREVIKSGTAICNASDTFDFQTGAKLAFDRLMGREEPKPELKKFFSVGDRVETRVGTGIITEVDDKDEEIPYRIRYDCGYEFWAFSKDAKPEPQPAHMFKVGDRVVHNEYGLGTIIGYLDLVPSVPYLVEPDNGNCFMNHWAEASVSPAPAPEPPKFYTGKVVCVEWKGDVFRHTNAGRIAMITNGISDYAGWNRMSKPFESFSDFCSANNFGVFYEIKE